MDLLHRLHRHDPPPPVIDHDEIREEMMQEDPEFARVRDVHHDALQVVGALSVADGISIRRERDWWSSRQHPPKGDQTNGGQKPC
jgi:hypothetical protein